MIEFKEMAECRTWYVVFDRPREGRWRWWRIFTGAAFSHCFAFSQAGSGVLRFEPLAWGIACTWHAGCIEDYIKGFSENGATAILSVTVDYRLAIDEPARGIYTCVSALKAVLALRKCPFTITPFQLYKKLCKHPGCIAIKPYTPYVGARHGFQNPGH